MANASAKRVASQNAATIKNLRLGTLVSGVLALIFRLILRRGALSPKTFAFWIYVVSLVPSIFLTRYLERIGSPRFDAATGTLISSGEDLSHAGVLEWCFDVVYVTWACQIGSGALGTWFWWFYLVIPGYAAWKLWGSVISPLVLGRGSTQNTAEEIYPPVDATRTATPELLDTVASGPSSMHSTTCEPAHGPIAPGIMSESQSDTASFPQPGIQTNDESFNQQEDSIILDHITSQANSEATCFPEIYEDVSASPSGLQDAFTRLSSEVHSVGASARVQEEDSRRSLDILSPVKPQLNESSVSSLPGSGPMVLAASTALLDTLTSPSDYPTGMHPSEGDRLSVVDVCASAIPSASGSPIADDNFDISVADSPFPPDLAPSTPAAASQESQNAFGDLVSEAMYLLSPTPNQPSPAAPLVALDNIRSIHSSASDSVTESGPEAASSRLELLPPIPEVDKAVVPMFEDATFDSGAGGTCPDDTASPCLEICTDPDSPASQTSDASLRLVSDARSVPSNLSLSQDSSFITPNGHVEPDTDMAPTEPLLASQPDEDYEDASMPEELSSSPMPSSSPPPLFSSSPPAWDMPSTPPSSSPPMYKDSDENSLNGMKIDVAFATAESAPETTQEVETSDADSVKVSSPRSFDSVAKRASQNLDSPLLSPPRPPNPKRPTPASQQKQYKKLATAFRSPLISNGSPLLRKDGIYSNPGGQECPTSRAEVDPKPLISPPPVDHTSSKDFTPSAAKQFKSPLAAMKLPDTLTATSSSTTKPPSVHSASNMQNLMAQVQKLKHAIKIKHDADLGGQNDLEPLLTKWTTAGREVAWAVWEYVKDVDAQTGGAWGEGGNVNKRPFDDAWGDGGDAKRQKRDGWGWDQEDRAEGQEAEMVVDEEADAPTATNSLGTMLRYMGIAPETLGWDEAEGDFVDRD
ncbi:hypothetical protein EIP91_011123 [Steccherinum ochraceum]|uniref:Uncharacterized protein n=1 Tax=Steccherinum ochraceum TaxID=92696 RepID=A0A4R0RVX3_9APHY|nr:hypothetical protein EIP91_011123 [Steccherinum ochraceum]